MMILLHFKWRDKHNLLSIFSVQRKQYLSNAGITDGNKFLKIVSNTIQNLKIQAPDKFGHQTNSRNQPKNSNKVALT